LPKPIQIEKESVKIDTVNFHIPTLLEEVKQLPKSKLRKSKKVIKAFLMTTTSVMILPLRSMAESLAQPAVVATTLPQSATGMPPELLELLLTLLKISVGAAVILAAILLVINAIGKMFRINGMTQWAKDIIRGLVQVLVAVPVVFLIYYVANLLFGHSGWFVSPF
jgi:hypothetical protein